MSERCSHVHSPAHTFCKFAQRSRQKAEALELKKQLVEAKNDLALAEITIDENGKIFEELQSELDEARARESLSLSLSLSLSRPPRPPPLALHQPGQCKL